MKKTFILDTSVLINDPDSLSKFENNEIILPYSVVEEIDNLRDQPNGRGMAARSIIEKIEEMILSNQSTSNMPLTNGGSLSVYVNKGKRRLSTKDEKDNYIINCALELKEQNKDVIVVSKDIGLRIKASAIADIEIQDYMATKVLNWYNKAGLYPDDVMVKMFGLNLHSGEIEAPEYLRENEFCYVIGEDGYETCGKILCRNKNGMLMPVPNFKKGVQGIHPQDDYQRMALDILMDPSIHLSMITGTAGGGKTLLSLAAGLHALSSGEVDAIMYIKPVIPVGKRDIGYLKGDKDEKLYHWVKPLFDNLHIIDMHNNRSRWDEMDMINDRRLEIEALTFMRGRTLHNYWVIIDETQNTTAQEIRTALSRMGKNTKCILLADPTQIDNPYVDAESCGIVYAIEYLQNESIVASAPLRNSHRSELSRLVTKLLPNND